MASKNVIPKLKMTLSLHRLTFLLRICTILLFTVFHIGVGTAEISPRLGNLTGSFERELSRAINPLNQKYTAALDTLQRNYSKSGELDSALVVKNEIERVREGKQLDNSEKGAEATALPPKLAKLKNSYQKAVERKAAPILTRHKKDLIRLQENMTASNDLESAVAVRDRIQHLEADSVATTVAKATAGEDASKQTTATKRNAPLADWLQEHEFHWSGNSGDVVIQFNDDNANVFANGTEIMERSFKVIDDDTIEFDWSNGDINTFILDNKRSSFLRRTSRTNIAMQGDIRSR